MRRPPVIVVQLIHITGPLKGKIQELPEGTISIGRNPSCEVRFPADLAVVSRKQAEIVREGNQFKLIDHSTNGTLVNGKRMREGYLKSGDVLEFSPGGPKASFLTEVREALPEAATVPPPIRREPAVEPPPIRPLSPREEKPRTPPPREEPREVPVQKTAAPLVIQFGPTIRSFRELPVTVGKSAKCDFVLASPGILDLHAQFFFSQDRYWIKDLTGQGIIRVNRQPVVSHSPLNRDDQVAFTPRGPFLRFLGEGRLAEVSGSPGEDSAVPSRDRREEESRADRADEKTTKGLLSRFRKDK
jgi:pSer/pThr/pTyr-binding forkhead associated (FHA) protein